MLSWSRPDPLTRDLVHLINARRHDHGDTDAAIDTLQAFLEQQGVDAIVQEYSDTARLYTETKIYHGKHAVHGFFVDFIEALQAGAIDRFELPALQVHGHLAYTPWSVGADIPWGTPPCFVW